VFVFDEYVDMSKKAEVGG